MGGFAGLLGHAAAGYQQAAQIDQQRQFEDTQARRQQMIGLLGKLAGDETVHPDVRSWATQTALEGVHAPFNKKWEPDFKKMPLSSGPPVPGPNTNLPNTPPMQVGGAQLPGVNPNAHMAGPPPPPPGIYNTPEQNTAMYAARTGALTGAQAGSEAGAPIMQYGPDGKLQTILPSKAPGQTFPDTFNPMMLRGMASMMHPVQYNDPQTGQPLFGMQNKLNQEIYGQNGELLPPGTVAFAPSLIGSQGTQRDPVTGLLMQTSNTKVLPKAAGGPPAPPTSQKPPTPPSSIGAAGQPEAVQGVTGVLPVGGQAAPQVGPPAPPPSTVTKGETTKASTSTGTASAPAMQAGANTIAGRSVPGQYYQQVQAMAKNMERNGEQPEGKFKGDVEAYMQENGMVPHTAQQVSDYQKAFDTAMSQDNRYKMMDELRKKIISDPSPENLGSYDAALLAYHMGMTMGQVKGMRQGKDLILMHEHARSLPENMQVAIQGWVNGSQLSPEQRKNFVDLADTSRQYAWQQAITQARGMGFSRFPRPTSGLPAVGFPPTINRTQLTAAAKAHNETYGNARKQAVEQGLNVDDY